MDVCKVTASLGGIDGSDALFTDQNFPPRKGLTPRLQSKIPKCFGWQMVPGYEYYLWIDGNIELSEEAVKYFLKEIQGFDLLVLRHPDRPNIRQEVRYTRKGINQQSQYMLDRYNGELHAELYELIENDKDYVDDLLVIGGVFMYKNTPKVHQMLKEWFYYQCRYIVQDQLSFPYVIKKSGIKYKVLDHSFKDWDKIKIIKHKI